MRKVDLVYTWVDNSDPIWVKKKKYWQSVENCPIDCNSNCRYINNDELKYSLRSVEKYAPWINMIYIITDNQIPKWLNTNHPKIRIVDHSEIIPKEYLPTFNSIAIEHCIMNIDNLSEYFLYANDDMFFAKPLTPEFFFANDNYPYFRYHLPYIRMPLTPYINYLKNADELVNKKLNYKADLFPHHNIDAYRKSDCIKCKEIFSEEIEKTVSSKFRDSSNIERLIYRTYSMAVGHGHYKGVFRIDRILPKFKNKSINYLYKLYKKESVYLVAEHDNFEERIENENVKLFCINDGENTTDVDRQKVKEFLKKYFSNPSSFEKL